MGPRVYVLRSRTGRHYYGSTADLHRRLLEHQRGKTHTTTREAPWTLVGHLACCSLHEARHLEKQFKRWTNPARVLAWLKSHGASTRPVG